MLQTDLIEKVQKEALGQVLGVFIAKTFVTGEMV
jgi:hypothetical protein